MAHTQTSSLVLGVAGDLLVAEEPRSHYLTKVGGAPWIPPAAGSSSTAPCDWEASSKCGVCGKPLSLVLQAYAPLTASEARRAGCPPCEERVLLVLACAHPGCGTAAGSWRAFRCQRPSPPSPSDPTTPAAASCQQAPMHAAPAAAEQGPVAAPLPPHHPQPQPQPHQQSADPFGGGFDFVGTADAAAAGVDCFDGFGAGFDEGAMDATGAATAAAAGAPAAVADDMDFSDLGAALEECAARQVEQLRQGGQAGKGQGQGGRRGGSMQQGQQRDQQAADQEASQQDAVMVGAAVPSVQLPMAGPPLPEFHIIGVEEPAGPHSSARRREQEHVQRLLSEYERQEQQAGGASARGGAAVHDSPSSCSAAAAASSNNTARRRNPQHAPSAQQQQQQQRPGGSGGSDGHMSEEEEGAEGDDAGMSAGGDDAGSEPGSWAGEEYEEDHVRGVHGAYLKYAARLARQPDQCARYGRGCEPLWPLKDGPQPPPCSHCGAPRVFELQLVAPLIALVLDCAGWLEGADLVRHTPAINAAANWDFATVAVFTCGANCCGFGSQGGAGHRDGCGLSEMAVMEEAVVLLSEEACHVPEELKLPK
ncbi:hypothetical protein Agub_g3495 [Astrephomene gubernaculifera]|uniref:Programmed cell death protein 2 C-terminal domain-containing protein n=1 Tax=Astrephomene gubernaculifera TaxID=47775 RepID=A0AAD3DK75_9CHLO|nr:hypothetical protein Agub_g3495 [Astrephomene gubernaculifera]